MKKISAIILAAGLGSRVGQPKWQLVYEGQSFFSIIVNKLLQLQLHEIVCVARKASVPSESAVMIATNHHPEYGMISSIYYGVEALQEADGYFIFPVDHPFVALETLQLLEKRYRQEKEVVLCPRYNDQRGHPIIVPKRVARMIPLQPVERGLKSVIRESPVDIVDVRVSDCGILKNINTLQELL